MFNMFQRKQAQQGGDGSTNVQAQAVTVINHGLEYSEYKQIALDVFNLNFYRLAEEANRIARERADEITNAYLEKLSERKPEAFEELRQPDMQYALFTAQKEYARSGDNNLSQILVDILVDRTIEQERSLMQIVLNESLEVVPKLTIDQINALSLIFLIRYTCFTDVKSWEEFSKEIEKFYIPCLDFLSKENSRYQHLEYTGCASISPSSQQIVENFKINYLGLFCKGFTEQDFKNTLGNEQLNENILVPCLNNNALFQVNAVDEEGIRSICIKAGASEDLTKKIIDLHKSNMLDDQSVRRVLLSIHPKMELLFEYWNESPLKMMTLTSVGVCIAHANIRRKTDETFDLGIWIK